MRVDVLAAYKPKPGKAHELLAVVREHRPVVGEQRLPLRASRRSAGPWLPSARRGRYPHESRTRLILLPLSRTAHRV